MSIKLITNFKMENMADLPFAEDQTETQVIEVNGMSIEIQEIGYHPLNAGLVWKGTSAFAKWLTEHRELLKEPVLEIGAGCGALAVYLRKQGIQFITPSDYPD